VLTDLFLIASLAAFAMYLNAATMPILPDISRPTRTSPSDKLGRYRASCGLRNCRKNISFVILPDSWG
jgi:hypothetical protein